MKEKNSLASRKKFLLNIPSIAAVNNNCNTHFCCDLSAGIVVTQTFLGGINATGVI